MTRLIERRMTMPGSNVETGVALVMSLVILLLLTIIGIAAMRTSSLEERMAGNIQDATHAFEAAESGLNAALTAPGSLDLNAETTNTFPFGMAEAQVATDFTQFSPPSRGSGYSATSFDAANFDQASTGTIGSARAVVHRGVAQIVPKN